MCCTRRQYSSLEANMCVTSDVFGDLCSIVTVSVEHALCCNLSWTYLSVLRSWLTSSTNVSAKLAWLYPKDPAVCYWPSAPVPDNGLNLLQLHTQLLGVDSSSLWCVNISFVSLLDCALWLNLLSPVKNSHGGHFNMFLDNRWAS